MPLRWPVRLVRTKGAPAVETVTENLSLDGFYCLSDEPFQVGDLLECVLALPALDIGYHEKPVRLRCRVKVIRVERAGPRFGLACKIEDTALVFSK